jgi:two-component system sensor histidine kinase KdpD
MARLQAGAVQLNRAWQPLEEVVGSALAACGDTLEGREVRVDLPEDLPLLKIDAVLFERVLVNLLENAAKYTPAESPIDISASAHSDRVDIVMDDHGPGLPKGGEERVFEKFERGQRESATPGVGLGLAICRAIVSAHDGTIQGQNRTKAGSPHTVLGTRFVITLPRGTPPTDLGTGHPTDPSAAA